MFISAKILRFRIPDRVPPFAVDNKANLCLYCIQILELNQIYLGCNIFVGAESHVQIKSSNLREH